MTKHVKFRILFAIMLFMSFSAYSQTIIQMEKDGGVYKIPCEINGLRLKLIFDTGASNVCISESIAVMMLENGYLEKGDIRGSSSSVVADGRIVDNTKINIRTLKIGSESLYNVEAVVMHQQSAPLLLGQSAIQKLGKISISGNLLILNGDDASKNQSVYEKDNGAYKDALAKAKEAYDNKMYELAVSYYDKCYGNIHFDIYTKYDYADSLHEIGKYSRAIDLYKEVEQSGELPWDIHVMLLSSMVDCYHCIGDYNSSILVGQNALLRCTYNAKMLIPHRGHLIHSMANIYIEYNGVAKAKQFILDEIRKYLYHKDMSALDCWDKGYRDAYIGHLYNYLGGVIAASKERNIDELTKYLRIAAAWGDQLSINRCNEFSISYMRKPANAEYMYY